jgi:hypothetical protein
VKEGATQSEPRPFHLPTHESILLSECTVLSGQRQHPLRVLKTSALFGPGFFQERTVSFDKFTLVYSRMERVAVADFRMLLLCQVRRLSQTDRQD